MPRRLGEEALINRKAIALLSTGHVMADFTQGAVAALIPFFVVERHWSYATAASLVLALNLSSSVVQPAFGHWADRKSRPWLIPTGLVLAGAGLALVGWMPSYALVVAVLAVAGMGVAAFHPAAAQALHGVAGPKLGTAMGVFSVGGSAGFALGPLVATGILLTAGLRGTALLILPAWLLAALLAANLRLFPVATRSGAAAGEGAVLRVSSNAWGAFAVLAAVLLCRSVAFAAVNAFLPAYWIGALGQGRAAGGAALSLLLATGAIGTLLGGWMGDRYGRKKVIALGLVFAGTLLLALPAVHNPGVAMALLVPLGVGLFAPSSVMVTLGQEYLPERVGLASGVTLGLAVTVGGLAAPLLGWVVDRHGFAAMFTTAALLALAASVTAGLLPRPRQAREPMLSVVRPPMLGDVP
jgi:FSR family fosmidomycin resistance protein-like MFS transporter